MTSVLARRERRLGRGPWTACTRLRQVSRQLRLLDASTPYRAERFDPDDILAQDSQIPPAIWRVPVSHISESDMKTQSTGPAVGSNRWAKNPFARSISSTQINRKRLQKKKKANTAPAPAAMASFGKDFFSGSGSGAAVGAYMRTAVSTRNANKKNHDAIWTNVGDDSVAGGGTQRAAGAAGAVFAFFFFCRRLRLIAVLLIERAKGFLAHLLEPAAGPVDDVFISDSEIWETGTRHTFGGICARMSSGWPLACRWDLGRRLEAPGVKAGLEVSVERGLANVRSGRARRRGRRFLPQPGPAETPRGRAEPAQGWTKVIQTPRRPPSTRPARRPGSVDD